DRFPFGVVGYAKLPGVTLSPESLTRMSEAGTARIASDLAAFLLALHRFPTDEALGIGLPGSYALEAGCQAMLNDTLPVLRTELEDHEYRAIERWWDAFLD